MRPDPVAGQQTFGRQRVRVPQPFPYADEAAPLGARRYVIYYKRMEVGRISRKVFRQSDAPRFYELRWDELVLFLEGIYLSAGRRKRFNNQ